MVLNSSYFIDNANLLGQLLLMSLFVFLGLCIIDYLKDLGKHTKSEKMKIIREEKEKIEREHFLFLLKLEREGDLWIKLQ